LTILDSKQYKETELQSWNSAAAGWQKWWKTIERGTEKVSKQLIALAEIKSGSRILILQQAWGNQLLPLPTK
jgi:enediyne biosynthesis protein CalE5